MKPKQFLYPEITFELCVRITLEVFVYVVWDYRRILHVQEFIILARILLLLDL